MHNFKVLDENRAHCNKYFPLTEKLTTNYLYALRAAAWVYFFELQNPTNGFGQKMNWGYDDQTVSKFCKECDRILRSRGLDPKCKKYKDEGITVAIGRVDNVA